MTAGPTRVLAGEGTVLRAGRVSLWCAVDATDAALPALEALTRLGEGPAGAGSAGADGVAHALALGLAGLAAARPGLAAGAVVETDALRVAVVLAGDATCHPQPAPVPGDPAPPGIPGVRIAVGTLTGPLRLGAAGVAGAAGASLEPAVLDLRAGRATGAGLQIAPAGGEATATEAALDGPPTARGPARQAGGAAAGGSTGIVYAKRRPRGGTGSPAPASTPLAPTPRAAPTATPVPAAPADATPTVAPDVAAAAAASGLSLPASAEVFDLRSPVADRPRPLPVGADDHAPEGAPSAPPAAAGTGRKGAAPAGPAGPAVPNPETVMGVRCSRGHFNHPAALYCHACGVAMVHQTRIAVAGPRPSLGVLVLDDGTVLALQQGWLLGTAPRAERAAAEGLRPFPMVDPQNALDAEHTAVRLHGWDVVVEDLGSRYGTWLTGTDGQWQQVATRTSQPLRPGVRLLVGRRVLVFESALRL